MANHCTADFFV